MGATGYLMARKKHRVRLYHVARHAMSELGSWLGFIILGILLYILMATALLQLANRLALGILVFFLGIAALKSVQQHQATKRKPNGGQKDSGDK